MSNKMTDSHVLLCRGSVEVSNPRDLEGNPTRMVFFNTFNTSFQEARSLMCANRIQDVRPGVSLVLMEYSVSSDVQAYLIENKISVVENVRCANLRRLARVLECDVADRVDNLGIHGRYKSGYFSKFKVENYQVGSQNKSICVFDACPSEKYATVLLRGSDSLMELRKVKHVLLEMVIANYNRVLGSSFLFILSTNLFSVGFFRTPKN